MKISLLGPVEVAGDDGTPIDLGGARLRRLLIRLAVQPEQIVSYDTLTDAVWPLGGAAPPPANAANALQQLISRLRRAGIPVTSQPGGYRLDVPGNDIDLFNGLAAGEWRGPVLAEVADQPWAGAHVARATEQRLAAQEASAVQIPELEALVAAHPLREKPVSLLMQALARQGRQAQALTVYERHRRLVAEELGADPSPELAGLHVSLLRGERVTRLPLALTSFVGREREMEQLHRLLERSRLVTLTGPGGSGKTRLALETARTLPRVWLVELAPLGDATDVAPAILAALGLRDPALVKQVRAGDPVERIVAVLSHQSGHLILDNCEHLLDAVAGLAQHVLSSCPRIGVLATSREPLGLGGETTYPVEPLPPEPALRLLRERAADSTPFVDLEVVAARRLCAALDGMPLAIELAAARLRTMPLEQLVSRLDERFRLLTGGSRTALPRHQTLRAVVDWSWELCSPAEREVWQRFAVFHGGADLAAAEAVCGGFGRLGALVEKSLIRVDGGRYRMLETIREYGLSHALSPEAELTHGRYYLALAEEAEPYLRGPQQLTWMSRLRADHDNLHSALRRAVGTGDADTAVRFAAALGWYWWLSGARAEGARLAAEALALDGPGIDPQRRALTYATAALNQMDSHGEFDKPMEWFARAAEISDGSHPVLRLVGPMNDATAHWPFESAAYQGLFDDPDPWVAATAMAFQAHTKLNLGNARAEAIGLFRRALAGYRVAGDRWGMSLVLEALSTVEAQDGEFATSAASAREAIGLLTELGTIEDLLQLRMRLATALWLQGDHDGCAETLRLAEAEAEQLGLPSGIALITFVRGALARGTGDLEAAQRHFADAGRLAAGTPVAPQFRAILASNQGLVAGEEGRLEQARRLHTEALEHALASSDAPVIGLTLVGCADLALREGDPVLAARMLGAATRSNGAVDHSLPDRPRIERGIVQAIGPSAYATAYAEGPALRLESLMP